MLAETEKHDNDMTARKKTNREGRSQGQETALLGLTPSDLFCQAGSIPNSMGTTEFIDEQIH